MISLPPDNDLPGEDWRPVPEFPCYEVSSFGRVRRGNRLKALRVATQNGYVYVDLYNGQRTTFRVHKLVLLTFVGECPRGCTVHHRDHDRSNNAISNLEYRSKAANDGDHLDPLWHEWIELEWDGEWDTSFEEYRDAKQELAALPF